MTPLSQDSEHHSSSPQRQAGPSSFRRWLVTGNVLAIALLVALVGLVLIQDRQFYRDQASITTRNLAQLLEQNIGALIAKTDVSLQTIGQEVILQAAQGGLDGEALEELLIRQKQLLPELAFLRIADARGMVIHGLAGLRPSHRDLSDRNCFIEARKNAKAGLIFEGPIKSRITQQWVILLARRLNGPDGRFLGIVYAAVGVDHFQELFAATGLGSDTRVTLLTTDGNLVARFPSPIGSELRYGSPVAWPELQEALRVAPDEGNYLVGKSWGDFGHAASYARVVGHPLYIDVSLPIERQLAPWRAEAFRLSSLSLLAILIMLMSSWMVDRLWRRQWQTTESLRESEERFRLMVEAVQDYAVFMLDAEGRVATWNEGGRRLTGYPAGDILGKPLSLLYPVREAETVDGETLAQVQTGKTVADEGWRLRRNGTRFVANTVIAAVRDGSGELRGFTVIMQDVTERRLAEQAARRANSLLQEAVESIAIGFSIYDADDRLVICNEAYRSLYRTSRDRIVPGVHFEHLIRHGAMQGQYPEALGKVDAWVEERVQRHRAANGIPLEESLDDGRHLLVVEYRTPSGHIVGNCTDITELHRHRHRLEELVAARTEEVQASMAQFRTLIEQAPTAMAMLDRKLNYLAVSRRWTREFGGGHKELIGKGLYELHQELPESWRATQRAALAGNSLHKDRDLWLHSDGHRQWLRWATYPWTDEKGLVGGVIISAEDITDRILGEEMLRESELRFRSAFEQAVAGLAHVALDGRFLRVNQKMCGITGYGREELLNCSVSDVVTQADWKKVAVVARRILEGNLPAYSAERQYLRRDGSRIWVNLTVSPVTTSAGLPDYLIVTLEDIERRKAAEFALEEGRETFHNLTRIASDLFWRMDEDYRFTMISEPTEDRSALEWERYLGLCLWELPALVTGIAERSACQRLIEARQPFRHLELALRNKNGEERWLSVSGDPVFSKNWQFRGYRGVVQDITERKASQTLLESYQRILEQQVAERTAALRAANKELQGFTYAASHDLRAPLGRINSFSTLLEKNYRQQLDGDGLLFLDFIRSNTTRMIALIEDMLAHAQIEQKILDYQPIPLPGIIQSVLRELEMEQLQRRIRVRCAPPDVHVQANPHGLSQVLRNILENAYKYSGGAASPRVEIGGSVHGGWCRLWIRDNGIGFDMTYHERIFEIFQRLHTYEEFPGSGVGLALVKKAMERMGGRVWAESMPGEGATFFLELPVHVLSEAPASDDDLGVGMGSPIGETE